MSDSSDNETPVDSGEEETFEAPKKGKAAPKKKAAATKKRKADAPKPKKAKTAVQFYMTDKRADVKQANPKFTTAEVNKELNRLWNEDLTEEDKKPYLKQAAEDMERYEAEAGPKKPKKALSAFMIFSNENRARIKDAHPDASFGELGKILGQEWNSLSEEKKKPYQDKAQEDKDRYTSEMQDFNEKHQ
jgi:hypothetical protein